MGFDPYRSGHEKWMKEGICRHVHIVTHVNDHTVVAKDTKVGMTELRSFSTWKWKKLQTTS